MDETTRPAETAKTFDLSYVPTEAFLRLVMRRWMWRAYGGFILGLPVVVAAAVVLASDMPWLSGFFAGFVVCVCTGYLRRRRAALRQLQRFAGETLDIRLSTEGLTFQTRLDSTRLPWNTLSRADVLRDVWMLRLRDRGGPVFLPSEILRGEPEAFLLDRLREHRILVEGVPGPHSP